MRGVSGLGGVTPPPSPGEGKGVIERIKRIAMQIFTGKFLSPKEPSIQREGLVRSLEPQVIKLAEGQTEAHRAAFDDDLDTFNRVGGAFQLDSDSDGSSVLHYAVEGAIESGKTETKVLDYILQLGPQDIAKWMGADNNGKNPLHLAIEGGRPDLAEKISQRLGALTGTPSWTAKDKAGNIPLNHFKKPEDFFNACLRLDLNHTPLSIALKIGREDALQVLKIQQHTKWRPEPHHLKLAIEAGNEEVVDHLFDNVRVADTAELMRFNDTLNAFHLAAKAGNLKMCKILIRRVAMTSTNQLRSVRLQELLEVDNSENHLPEELAPNGSDVHKLLKVIREEHAAREGLTLDNIMDWQPPPA
jgi:ankyrin repeat protein